MTLIAAECCCAPGVMDCFFGLDTDTLCCRLSQEDILMLRIPRPAGSKHFAYPLQGPVCGGQFGPCDGEYMTGLLSWPASEDLFVMYKKPTLDASTSDRTHMWFFDNGSFGTSGEESFDSRASLWPPAASACCEDCNNNEGSPPMVCVCESGWHGPTLGIGNPPGTTLGCDNLTSQLDTLQKNLIKTGSTNGVGGVNFCDPPGSAAWTSTCNTGDAHKWLQGIADDGGGKHYRHWEWDVLLDNYVKSTVLKYLAETLVAVFHPERWYEACYKHPDDLGSAWNCRVPNWWAFGCSGVPVFSWEIGRMQEEGILSTLETSHFFRQVYENKPMGAVSTDLTTAAEVVAFIEKLERNTFTHSDSADGFGVLQTKDWIGSNKSDPVGGTFVALDTDKKIVRKDLSRWTSAALDVSGNPTGIETIVYDEFYYGRPGGWSEICQYPCLSAPTSSATYVKENAPQVIRGKGCTGSDALCREAGRDLSCFSASPTPTAPYTCTDSGFSCNGCQGCDIWNPAGPVTPPCISGCGPPVQAACDVAYDVCNRTSYASRCEGVHFQYNGYNEEYDAPPTNAGTPFSCDIENHAWLWILNRTFSEDDAIEPFSCNAPNCPPGAYDNLGDASGAITPPQMGNNIRCGEPSSNPQVTLDFCSGSNPTVAADGLSGGYEVCFTTGASKIPDTAHRDPGNGMVGVGLGGCGTYLCNDKIPLGACCKTDDSTRPPVVTCIDAVTAGQCQKCEDDANVTTVWHGPAAPGSPSPCCNGLTC